MSPFFTWQIAEKEDWRAVAVASGAVVQQELPPDFSEMLSSSPSAPIEVLRSYAILIYSEPRRCRVVLQSGELWCYG